MSAPRLPILAKLHDEGLGYGIGPALVCQEAEQIIAELYEVGFRILECIDHPKARIRQLDIDALRAALAKARGEQ